MASALLLLLGTACAPPRPPSVAGIQCVPRALGAQGLASEWQRFANHILACVVVDPKGTPALEILTVSAQSVYEERPRDPTLLGMPAPIILLPGGRTAGYLPYGYPDDPPRATTLEFSRWQAGLPERITMRVSDASAAGDRKIVLQWNAAQARYAVARAQ